MSAAKCKIEMTPTSDKWKAVAEKELRETPDVVGPAIAELKELIKKDGTIEINTDDDALMKVFLRPTKYYPESALKLIKRALEFKEKNADLLENLKPESIKDVILKSDVVNVLIDRDQDGRRVLIVRAGSNWTPKEVTTDHIFKMFYLVHLAAMLEPETQVCGVVVIMDFDGLGMKQSAGFTPSFARRLLTFIQDAMPLRLKEVHIVKQPMIFNMVWKLFSPFVGKKLNERLFWHGKDMDKLHKKMDPACLPADYGGQKPKIDYDVKDWYPEINKCLSHIEAWNSFKLIK